MTEAAPSVRTVRVMRENLLKWLGPAVIAVAFGCMFRWTWGTWPDAAIDFGRELYTPWQLSEGKVLYRDVASFYGPLSPYLNALWFTLFGVSLQTLAWCNAAIVVVLLYWVFHILTFVGGRLSATMGCLLFIAIFGFGQLVNVSNYNYICPYSHEAMHGVVLAIGSIFFFMRFAQTSRLFHVIASGVMLGTVFICKPESFLAAAAALIGGWALLMARMDQTPARVRRALGLWFGSAIAPGLVAFALLSTAMPAAEALRSTLGSWPFLFDDRLTTLPFFRIGMGTINVKGNLWAMAVAAFWQALILVPAALIAMLVPADRRVRLAAAIGVFAVASAVLWRLRASPEWLNSARLLPLWMVSAGLVSSWACWRSRNDPAHANVQLMRAVMAAFGLGMLLKMILFARFSHYGFILAMPATLVLTSVLVDWIPARLSQLGGAGGGFRGAALAALGMAAVVAMATTRHWVDLKTFALGGDGDRFKSLPGREPLMAATMDWLQANAPGESFVVLPEGVMLNYLTRTPSTTRYLTFLPSDLIMFGEQAMLESLNASPPDYIVLVHRDTKREYGAAFFGSDYGVTIYRWILERYEPVWLVGDMPLQPDSLYGIGILKRLPAASAAPGG